MTCQDDVRLSVAVMCHPSRADRARAICAAHPDLDASVVLDPDPSGAPSTLRTAVRAWGAVRDDATHHLVLQDDVQLAASFLPRVLQAVRQQPDAAVSLFTEWGSRTAWAVRLAALVGASWAPLVDDYLPSVALVLPTRTARGFARFASGARALDQPDDVVLHGYVTREGLRATVPVAGLVEHDADDSVIGNAWMGVRRSASYSHESLDADEFAAGVADVDALPCVSWQRARDYALFREPGSARWGDADADRLVAHLGWTASQVSAAVLEVTRATRPPVVGVAQEALDSVYRAALLLGALAGPAARPSRLAPGSLATLAPGALRNYVTSGTLDDFQRATQDTITALVRRGAVERHMPGKHRERSRT